MQKTVLMGILIAFLFFQAKESHAQGTFQLHENGVTITCEGASPGETGVVDGVTYTAVDSDLLIERRNNEEDLSKVCTSLITDLKNFFIGDVEFNQDIKSWDVRNVSNMEALFLGCDLFNQDLSYWDVSSVTNMAFMFAEAQAFNQNIGSWNVSSVTDMSRMFLSTEVFNQNLNNWDVSKVQTMQLMFGKAKAFNNPIDDWDVSSVTNMAGLFSDAWSFNQNISSWDVSSVTNMSGIFHGTDFNQSLADWDVSSVTDMSGMFSGAYNFNGDIGEWNVENVENMANMLRGAESFNQDLTAWCVENIVSEPDGFAVNSALLSSNYPIWGTCPDITPNEEEPELPIELGLSQNYPNPFNPSTVINYQLAENSLASLKVYDLLGREVAELVNTVQSAGEHSVSFDGAGLSSGVYVYQLQTPTKVLSRQMLLIK